MIIGVPKEIKNNEFRVALTPASAQELILQGHRVLIEKDAGTAIDFRNQDYLDAGAEILPDAKSVFTQAEMILKVKEPQAVERKMLKADQTLFTYLHLAPDPEQTQDLLQSGAVCIAYETVVDDHGRLPLLAPMSEVAGRMSIQAGAHCLEKEQGGRGMLLGGVPGVEPATVMILGAGVVGSNAAEMAMGMGARVVILDKNLAALRSLSQIHQNRITTVYSTAQSIAYWAEQADLIIGGVLIPGASAPKLIRREHLKTMKPGAAIVDVAIDQGGCFETSHATTHDEPTFIEEGIIHYCVANMPGAVARTSTQSLNNATLPYILQLANQGVKAALSRNTGLLQGLNVSQGKLCCQEVAQAQNLDFVSRESCLEQLAD